MLGEVPIKIGLDDPFTGTYAELGLQEKIGCELAVAEINKKGGILGRHVELIVEGSSSTDTGTAVQEAQKLIDHDKVNFLLGNVKSARALATGNLSHRDGVLLVAAGGHMDVVTGTEGTLKKFGGTEVGASLTPLGTTDFSFYLIKAEAAKPNVIIFLTAGQDAVSLLKQAVQFGLDKKFHIAGVQQELAVLEGLPPQARIGTWVFEWYWEQPNDPHVKEFVASIRKVNNGKVPTTRLWFGCAATWTCVLVANEKKTLRAETLAEGLENFTLPLKAAVMPDKVFYRAGDHQLMPDLYVVTR